MILNKDSLIQLLTQNGCEYCACPPSLTYKDYRVLSFNHWFYDTDTDFRLHTHLTKTLLTNHGIRCKYTNTSPEFILSHLEKFKMWVAYNGYTAKDAEAVYNDFKQFITEN